MSILRKMIALAEGELIPSSKLTAPVFSDMEEEGVLVTVARGSRRSLRAVSAEAVRHYAASKLNIRDLEAALHAFESEDVTRADLVRHGGDSKNKEVRAVKGILVNVYKPVKVYLNGKELLLTPIDGATTFIFDYESFLLPENAVVIGMENGENFRYVSRQRKLFESVVPEGTPVVCVCRYPQNKNHDLYNWLEMIPNRYIHFGDLDLAGVRIYLTEYRSRLGKRASMLIPPDYEERIKSGSLKRYDVQGTGTKNMELADPRVAPLVECIHKYHRGYDQEGYIDN